MYFTTTILFLLFEIAKCNLWPKGIVHYSINPKDYDPHSRDVIMETLRKIQNEVCVKFFSVPVNYTAEEGHKIVHIQNPTKEKTCPPRTYDFNKSVIDMPVGYKCLNERDIARTVVEMLKASIHKSETIVNSYDLLKKFQEKNENSDRTSILSSNDRNYINAHYFQECGGMTQRSAPARRQNYDEDLDSEFTALNRQYYRSKVWPMGIVLYKVNAKLRQSADLAIVLRAMRTIEKADSCVMFLEADVDHELDSKNMIAFEEEGADWPALGFQEGIQVLKLSSIARCGDPGHSSHALMMMMRILGLPMMSNRYDRDNYISIHWNNVQKGEELYLEKAPEAAWLKHIPYDFSSVSHAPANFLCPGCLTTYTVEPIQDHLWRRTLEMGRRMQLSADDVRLINTVYAEQCQARSLVPAYADGGATVDGQQVDTIKNKGEETQKLHKADDPVPENEPEEGVVSGLDD